MLKTKKKSEKSSQKFILYHMHFKIKAPYERVFDCVRWLSTAKTDTAKTCPKIERWLLLHGFHSLAVSMVTSISQQQLRSLL